MANQPIPFKHLLKRIYQWYGPYVNWSDNNKWHFFSLTGILLANILLAFCNLHITIATGALIGALCLPGITYLAFLPYLINLLAAIFFYTLTSAFNVWNTTWLKMSLSKKMNREFLKKWMKNKAYYYLADTSLHPAQIIGADNENLTGTSIDLMDRSALMLCQFSISAIILCQMSVPLVFCAFGITFTLPGLMLIGTITYAITYNYLLDFTARPLKTQQQAQNQCKIELINNIHHINNHAESIAFKRGEKYEHRQAIQQIQQLNFIDQALAKTRTLIHSLTTAHAKLSSVIAIIFYAPYIITQKVAVAKIFELTGYFFHVTRLFTWKRETIDQMTNCYLLVKKIQHFDQRLSQNARVQAQRKLIFSSPAKATSLLRGAAKLQTDNKSTLKIQTAPMLNKNRSGNIFC